MSNDTEIRTDLLDGILTITLDGPKVRNAVTAENLAEIRAILADVTLHGEVAAVVLTGADGFFSAGGNLKGIKRTAESPASVGASNTDRLNAMILGLRNCPLPVIAAIEGGAAGVGVSIALACDMIVASNTAKFTVAYVKVGLTPDGGVTHFLAEALPRQLASELCMLGRPITAKRLADYGIINAMAEPGKVLARAKSLAIEFANTPREAVSLIKSEISLASQTSLAEQLAVEAGHHNQSRHGPEGREGIAAFLEKRAPRFGSND